MSGVILDNASEKGKRFCVEPLRIRIPQKKTKKTEHLCRRMNELMARDKKKEIRGHDGRGAVPMMKLKGAHPGNIPPTLPHGVLVQYQTWRMKARREHTMESDERKRRQGRVEQKLYRMNGRKRGLDRTGYAGQSRGGKHRGGMFVL